MVYETTIYSTETIGSYMYYIGFIFYMLVHALFSSVSPAIYSTVQISLLPPHIRYMYVCCPYLVITMAYNASDITMYRCIIPVHMCKYIHLYCKNSIGSWLYTSSVVQVNMSRVNYLFFV